MVVDHLSPKISCQRWGELLCQLPTLPGLRMMQCCPRSSTLTEQYETKPSPPHIPDGSAWKLLPLAPWTATDNSRETRPAAGDSAAGIQVAFRSIQIVLQAAGMQVGPGFGPGGVRRGGFGPGVSSILLGPGWLRAWRCHTACERVARHYT